MFKGREYIKGFDLLKFIMALIIVSLHSELSKSFGEPFSDWVLNFQSLAVPTFFVLSSILFFDKVNSLENPRLELLQLLQFEKRVFILYAIWSIIMIPITLRYHNYVQEGLFGFLLFVKDFFFNYTFLASWFLGALLVSVPIVFALRKHSVILLLLSILIYAYNFTLESLPAAMHLPYDWYHSNMGSPERSFLCGIVWVGIGCVLSTKKVLSKVKAAFGNKTKAMLTGGGILLIISVLTSFALKEFKLLGVLALVFSFYLMPLGASNEVLYKTLRKSSIIIYCIHYPIIHLVWRFVPNEQPLLTFVISAVISIIIAITIVLLSNVKQLKFFRYLY